MKPTSLYDAIDITCPLDAGLSPFRWVVGYQGETDFEMKPAVAPRNYGHAGTRLRFRHTKVPWQWSWANYKYWNYPDEETFEKSGPNARHGMLLMGIHCVPRYVLELFRQHHCATAITGYWCSASKTYIPLQLHEAPETWEQCLSLCDRKAA